MVKKRETEITSQVVHIGQIRSGYRMHKAIDGSFPSVVSGIIVSRTLTLHPAGIPKTYSRPTVPNSSGFGQVASLSKTYQRRKFHSQPETRDAGRPASATPCPAYVRQNAPGYCLRAGSEIPGPSSLRRGHFPATE